MNHKHPKSGTGKAHLGDIIQALKDKGVQGVTSDGPSVPTPVEDAAEVARVVKANPQPERLTKPPVSVSLREEPAIEKIEAGFTEEEEFRRRRMEARRKLREQGGM